MHCPWFLNCGKLRQPPFLHCSLDVGNGWASVTMLDGKLEPNSAAIRFPPNGGVASHGLQMLPFYVGWIREGMVNPRAASADIG